ncbi:unnamed protein product [marine sediment metagenome]|uniref:Uncharacterized protein n=1 Tax=marine sediment metagenome TaxID=412755 RepID=X1SRY7_9ZZZZ
MARYRNCTTLSGDYLAIRERRCRLRNNADQIEHLRAAFYTASDHLDVLHEAEPQLTRRQHDTQLDILWSELRMIGEHLKKIIG